MVADLLARLGRDRRDALVHRPRERAEQHQVPLVEQELARHGVRVVPVGLFDEQQVAELAAIAQERELVLAPARRRVACLDFLCVREPHPALPQQVQPDVGERDVLLQRRTLADPLAEALRKNDPVVGQPQHVVEKLGIVVHRGRRKRRPRLQMCFTSSGIGKNVGCR